MKKFKIFAIIILFFTIIVSISFAAASTSAAGNVASSAGSLLQEGFKTLQKILNLMFIFVRPLLIIAGKLLSNKFIYGDVFGIHEVLLKVWQLIRTFMNYFMGILFLVSIIVYYFKSNSKFALKQMLPKIVMASIVVNMSRFFLQVLLDLSTIFTVSAGGIGMQFHKIMGKGGGKDIREKVIILPVTINTDNPKAVLQTKINGKIYHFCIKNKEMEVQNPPCIDFTEGAYELVVDKSGKTQEIKGGIKGKDVDSAAVGMLFSIFRYMNMAFVVDNTNGENVIFWAYVVKILLMLALVIPFLLLSVILMIRVMVLRVVIPTSSILFGIPILGVFDSQVKDKLTNVVALIFQPAYVVFMLAIGFVFIQAIYAMMPSVGGAEKSKKILKTLNIEKKGKNKVLMSGILEITSNYDKGNGTNTDMSDFKNLLPYLAWLIANIIAIMIMWMLVFTAFKSNSFTKKIATSVDTFAKGGLKTLPVLPGGQSIASLGKAAHYLERVPGQMATSQYQKMETEVKKLLKK